MINLLRKKQKSLVDILESFHKTIAELEDLRDSNLRVAESNDALVATLEARSRGLRDEAGKAERVAGNIEKLVGEV